MANRRHTFVALALSALICGCASNEANRVSAHRSMNHAITLPAPSDAERSSMRPGKKGEPLQVGFGREVPATQRRIALADLSWRALDSGGYATSIAVKSTGARSLRVALKLNRNVCGLEFVFVASNATVPAATIASELYWSPVTQGDTVTIELEAKMRPSSAVLEIPTISHIP